MLTVKLLIFFLVINEIMIYRNDRLAFSLSVTALLQLLTKTALCDNNER